MEQCQPTICNHIHSFRITPCYSIFQNMKHYAVDYQMAMCVVEEGGAMYKAWILLHDSHREFDLCR